MPRINLETLEAELRDSSIEGADASEDRDDDDVKRRLAVALSEVKLLRREKKRLKHQLMVWKRRFDTVSGRSRLPSSNNVIRLR